MSAEMIAATEPFHDEARSVRRDLRELTAIATLSAVWARGEPGDIADSLATVLCRALPLELLYVSVKTVGGPALEAARVSEGPLSAAQAGQLGRRLDPLIDRHSNNGPLTIANPFGEGTMRLAVVPLGLGGEMGVLVAGSVQVEFPREHEAVLLGVAANQATIALQNSQAQRALREAEEAQKWNARRHLLLSQTAARLLASTDAQQVVDSLCRDVLEFLDCHAFFNYLVDERAGRLRLNAWAGIPADEAKNIEWLDFGRAVCGCVARDSQRIIANNISTTIDPRMELVKSHGIRAYCCHPMMMQHRLIGTLSFGTRSRDQFTQGEIEVMEAVSDLVAIAMHRIRTEQALRESEERNRQLLSFMPAAVYSCDASGVITYFNDRAAQLWGRTPQLGDTDERFCGSEQMILPDGTPLPHEQCPMALALREGRPFRETEVNVRRPDRSLVTVSVNIEPIRNVQGDIVGAINAFHDVTAIRQAERALHDREAWRAGQKQALQAALNGEPLDVSLGLLVQTAIQQFGAATRAAFYLTNPQNTTLHHVVGMPDDYARAVDGIEVGPESLACGLSAHTPTLTTDVTKDPVWQPWLWLAQRYGYRGCWRFPVHTAEGKAVGMFAVYWRQPREATNRDLMLADAITETAGVIIARHSDELARNRAEQRLRESELRFRSMIDALPTAVYTTDGRGRITHFNPACIAFSGREPVLGTDHWCVTWKLFHPDGRAMPHDECPMAIALKEGRAIRGAEAIAERPDGTRVWFEAYPTPLLDDKGNVLGGINMLVDITERKKADQAIRRSERDLKDFFETASIGLHWVGPDGIILRVNQAELDMLGYTCDEYVGRHIAEFHVDQAVIEDILARLARGETLRECTASMRRKDGSIRDVLINSSVLFENGEFIHTRCFTTDVTDRNRAEQALRESEERFRMLADNMAQLAWTCDKLGNRTWYNKRWLDYTGLSFEELKDWGWKKVHHPEHVDRAIASLTHSIKSGEPWEGTFPLRGKDGQYRWFLTRALPIRDERGDIVRWFATNTDVTAQRQHEEQMRTVMAELNHRVKNTLATVEAVARQTLHGADSLSSFAESFGARLRSMAAAHSLLTRAEWTGAELAEILRAELVARVASPEHLALQGPGVLFEPQAALALHMAVHELATNAAKYGALSVASGRLQVEWEISGAGDDQRLSITWAEQGGPPVAVPKKRGFGQHMITQVIEYELNGKVENFFEADGFRCRITLSVGAVHARGGESAACERHPIWRAAF